MSRLETLVLHSYGALRWVDAADGGALQARVEIDWASAASPAPRRLRQDEGGLVILELAAGPDGRPDRGARVVAGAAGDADLQVPADGPLDLAGTVRPLDGRVLPRRFRLQLEAGAVQELALFRRPGGQRLPVGGSLSCTLRHAAAGDPSGWTPAAWALLELAVVGGPTLRAQADEHGDAVLSLAGLPPLAPGVEEHEAQLSVRAPSAPSAGPVDPDHDLVPWQLATGVAGDGSPTGADHLPLQLVPGRSRRLVSPSFPAVVLTAPA